MGGPILPTPEEAAWQLARPQDSFVTGLVVTSAICSALATVFVGLRIWSKRLLHGKFRLEINDLFCVAALIFFYGTETVIAVATLYGLGRHVVFIKDTRLVFILALASENFYPLVLTFLKLSVLSLYRQLFKSKVWFYRITWAVSFAVAFQNAVVILVFNLQCIPISAGWDPTIKGTCINVGLFALFFDLSNIVFDFVILAMPVPLVLKLQVSRQKKRMLIATFATGGSACVISIIQLKYISKLSSTSDSTWNNAPVAIVVSIECMIGFLAVCIVTYRPLYRYLFTGTGLARVTPIGYRTLMEEPYRAHISAGERPSSKNLINQSCRGITATNEIELVYHVDRDGVWIRVENDGTDMYK
ncbi:hypothetical protein F4860DRAFT_478841 [Xylaria cubensis]|nr:hypothetical protein F4860DRAFT_478841 [Xylaria cubensis]